MTQLPLVVSDAGIRGLIVAALAARQGRPVTVIGRAAPLQLTLGDAEQRRDLLPQIWPADSLERLIRRLDLRLTIRQPELPLQIVLRDGRRFDDWQDPHRRAVSRRNWIQSAGAADVWRAAGQAARQLQRDVGGSGGIINAMSLARQRGRSLRTALQQYRLDPAAQTAFIALIDALRDPTDDEPSWLQAAAMSAAGGERRAVIVGGRPALAAALSDAILRDGGELLPQRRIRTVSAADGRLSLTLQHGIVPAADRLVIDGGRRRPPTAVMSAVSLLPRDREQAALQIRQQPDGSRRIVAVTESADPQILIVSAAQPLNTVQLAALRSADSATRKAARCELAAQLINELQPFAPQQARPAVIEAAPQHSAAAAQPRVTRIEQSDDLSSLFGAELIEGIGTAQRLGFC